MTSQISNDQCHTTKTKNRFLTFLLDLFSAKALPFRSPPPGYSVLPTDDPNSFVQDGDLIWYIDDSRWREADHDDVGDYVDHHYYVARRAHHNIRPA